MAKAQVPTSVFCCHRYECTCPVSNWIKAYVTSYFHNVPRCGRAKLNFVEYAEVVRDSLATSSDACVTAVQSATTALEELVATADGRAKLTAKFKSVFHLDITCYS